MFHLSKQMNNPLYKNHAEILIDDIFKNIENNEVCLGFDNGLAGICWGIEHLVQNGFLVADTNYVLSDLDDKIYRFLSINKNLSINLENGLLGYGFYLISRLDRTELDNSSDWGIQIRNHLLIDIVNRLYNEIEQDEQHLSEPAIFQITWPLPLTLIFLAEVRKFNIYNHKVDIILKRLEPLVFSTFPRKQGNRVFLFIASKLVLSKNNLPQWSEYIEKLKQNMELDEVPKEFSDKNIIVNEGMAGIGVILQIFSTDFETEEFKALQLKIADRIFQSSSWVNIKQKELFKTNNLGILRGLAGVAFSVLPLTRPEEVLDY